MSDRSEPRPGGGPTILVVDDSSAIRRIIGRTLAETGYRVVEAADGQAALETCRAELPDLVLLDVDMPVMDGTATLRAIRSHRRLQSLPVLFLTAHTSADDVAAGLDLGAQDYLRKPCEPAELIARVARALRSKAHEDGLSRRADEMLEMSTTDTLTGLGNRRRLEAKLDELRMTHVLDTPLTVIIVDIDHFKAVNDTFGHTVGDVVLRVVASRLENATDDQLLVTRWGGEEFLVTGVGLDASHGASVAERLRGAVAATPIAVAPDLAIPVTASAGCAGGTLAGFAPAVEAADTALYEAKRLGRNRVVSAVPRD